MDAGDARRAVWSIRPVPHAAALVTGARVDAEALEREAHRFPATADGRVAVALPGQRQEGLAHFVAVRRRGHDREHA
jgi:hypothetical protein